MSVCPLLDVVGGSGVDVDYNKVLEGGSTNTPGPALGVYFSTSCGAASPEMAFSAAFFFFLADLDWLAEVFRSFWNNKYNKMQLLNTSASSTDMGPSQN